MRWPQDATGWPLREVSRLVLCRPHRWHVQEAGAGPTLLLLPGAGGATQSFRDLFPLLAVDHHVLAVDLPGQGFTQAGARGRSGLEATAEDLGRLLRAEGWAPDAIIGHSAGAALALRLADRPDPPKVVGINAALANFRGVAGVLFPALARILALSPFTADLVAASMTEATVRSLIRNTGSEIGAEGIALYTRLAQDRAHVDAVLAMMAQWTLDPLLERLPELAAETLLIVGEGDLAVPPQTSRAAAARLPRARILSLPRLGHLAHEEAPELMAAAIRDFLRP